MVKILTSPGRDDLTRVATLKTKTGIYKRPVVKLVLLVPQPGIKDVSSFGGQNVKDS